MKKLLSLLLALALVLSLAGCVNIPDAPSTDPSLSTTVSTEATDPTASTLPQTTETTAPAESQPEQTDPTVAKPIETDPPETKPVQTDPPETKPVQTDPPETKPVQTDPPETEPVQTDPPETKPVQTDPPETEPKQTDPPETEPSYILDPNGSYTSKNDVALFIHLYGRLPNNFITKSQARAYGWRSGSLERYAPGKCIGGDVFRNQEGRLPAGHSYFECDIDTLGSYSGRGSKRIVYSSDGLVYYTGDHYRTFTLLYGEL